MAEVFCNGILSLQQEHPKVSLMLKQKVFFTPKTVSSSVSFNPKKEKN
jgi:hypothetical protein